jgi:hypothetical protein
MTILFSFLKNYSCINEIRTNLKIANILKNHTQNFLFWEHIYPDFEGPFRPSRQISKSSARIYHSDCWWSFSDITPIFKTVSIVLCNIHVQDVTCWSFKYTSISRDMLWVLAITQRIDNMGNLKQYLSQFPINNHDYFI